MRKNRYQIFAIALCAASFYAMPSIADDRLSDAIKRVAYWHLHVKQYSQFNGTTKVERDIDQCLDLRNPVPAVNRLPQFHCTDLNVQKSPAAYHMRAACTFANNGSMTGHTDIQLKKDGVGVSYFEEVNASWYKPDGTPVHSERTTTGRLVGECPANARIMTAGTTTPPTYPAWGKKQGN